MKITISGTLGSGKSTVAKMLAKHLNYSHYTLGTITREMAKKRGLTLAQFSALEEQDPSIDKEVDAQQQKLINEDNFILESRLGYHFVPNSIKIFFKCSQDIAAQRVLNSLNQGDAHRLNEGLSNNKDEILQDLLQRRASEKKRYKQIYNLDYEEESNYDLVVDTSNISPQEVFDKILNFLNNQKN